MDPLSTTTVRRPFHWGLVVLAGADWTGDIPEVVAGRPVTASDRVLLVPVRHAQDTDEYEGEHVRLARAEVVVRRWERLPASSSPLLEVYRGALHVPTGSLTVGDADEWVTVPVAAGVNAVRVSLDDGAAGDPSPDRAWVDIAPAPMP